MLTKKFLEEVSKDIFPVDNRGYFGGSREWTYISYFTLMN